MLDLLLIEWVTKMKPGSNSVEDHPQLSHNRHPVDGVLVDGLCGHQHGGWWVEEKSNLITCRPYTGTEMGCIKGKIITMAGAFDFVDNLRFWVSF